MNEQKPVRYYLIWLLVWLAALALSVVLLVSTEKPVTAGQTLSAFVAAVWVVHCITRLVRAYQAKRSREK